MTIVDPPALPYGTAKGAQGDRVEVRTSFLGGVLLWAGDPLDGEDQDGWSVARVGPADQPALAAAVAGYRATVVAHPEGLPDVRIEEMMGWQWFLDGVGWLPVEAESPLVAHVAVARARREAARRGPLDGLGVGSVAYARQSGVALHSPFPGKWTTIDGRPTVEQECWTAEEATQCYGARQIDVQYRVEVAP